MYHLPWYNGSNVAFRVGDAAVENYVFRFHSRLAATVHHYISLLPSSWHSVERRNVSDAVSASLMPQNVKNMKPVLSVALDLSDLSGDKDWLHSMGTADWVLYFLCVN
jgi:hypothetical protein